MEKCKITNGLWFWGKYDGYFRKINCPCYVLEVLTEKIKIKIFRKLGEVEEVTLDRNEVESLLTTNIQMG